MAYDEGVVQRIREILEGRDEFAEKKMFGGIAFMHNGNMCVGVNKDRLMARVGPEAHAEAIARPHAREMDFTGRAMKGFVYVDPEGFAQENDLIDWIALCERFTGSLPAK